MIDLNIDDSTTLNKLITKLITRGGTINKYYLQDWNKNKHAVVYLEGWFAGKNIREAILKALA